MCAPDLLCLTVLFLEFPRCLFPHLAYLKKIMIFPQPYLVLSHIPLQDKDEKQSRWITHEHQYINVDLTWPGKVSLLSGVGVGNQ